MKEGIQRMMSLFPLPLHLGRIQKRPRERNGLNGARIAYTPLPSQPVVALI